MGGGPHFFLVGILIFLLVRRPRKILEPYDNPFWEKSLWWWVVGGWWVVCKPILVFSFDFGQAEQKKYTFQVNQYSNDHIVLYFIKFIN